MKWSTTNYFLQKYFLENVHIICSGHHEHIIVHLIFAFDEKIIIIKEKQIN